MFWPAAHRCRRPLSAALLTSVTLVACSPQPDPYKADPVQAIAENRFLRVIHSPDPVPEEEPPPEEQENTDEAVGSGHRHRGEEGKMGRPTARAKSGLYAMKGPKDAIPRYAPSALPAACDGCEAPGADRYQRPADNPWTRVLAEPLSTFSIDVDTASYSNVRRFILGGSLPPAAAVRTEELINYFDYGYAPPSDGRPLAVHAEVAPCPWNPTHKLVHVGLKGKVVPPSELGPRNLVFLVDVSGSMESEDKLPLLAGPAGTSLEVMSAWSAYGKQLEPLGQGLELAELRLSPRRAWQVKLDNGSTLELGRNEAPERLARFVRAYGSVPALQAANARVDLRYASGLALRGVFVKPVVRKAGTTRAATKPARR